jgi:hypothetical protein
MSTSGRRVIATAVAAASGGASAVVTNVLTDRWASCGGWPSACCLSSASRRSCS